METQDLIVIEQLPIIKEQLKKVATEIDKKVEETINLVCTEENKQVVKNVRSELKKELENFERQRKAVKEQVLAPYMQFEKIYKECISDKYKLADKDLKAKIDNIENEQKKKLEDGAREYFEEYKISKNIDFITFENMNLKVGLSDNPTKLRREVTSFIDKIVEDLKLIETQECKDEILVEYKQNLNVSRAIQDVANRHKLLDEERRKQEEQKIVHLEMNEKQKITKESDEQLENIFNKPLEEPKVEEKQDEILTLRFTVKATRTKLKELKNFLENGGYDYE